MDNPTNKGGRPPFKPTKKQRDEVMNLIATGSNMNEVIAAIGVDKETLHKHFAVELATAKSKKRNGI